MRVDWRTKDAIVSYFNAVLLSNLTLEKTEFCLNSGYDNRKRYFISLSLSYFKRIGRSMDFAAQSPASNPQAETAFASPS
jgi:hypothetical protein